MSIRGVLLLTTPVYFFLQILQILQNEPLLLLRGRDESYKTINSLERRKHMAKRYGLIYGDDYEKRQYWIQFVTVLEQSRGRRNHIIFMIITALIKELGLSDCNDLIMINTLER